MALVGLVGLLFVDVLLVVLAFRPDTAGASTQAPAPPAAATTAAPTTPRATSAVAVQLTMQAVPLTELISAVDGTRAWRATLGSCRDGGASLSVTGDGGRTWTKRAVPARALGRIQPVATTRGFVIGAKEGGCAVGEYSTSDNAATWQGPRAVDGGWSRVPGGDPSIVITPQRPDARPCGTAAVIDLARVSATSAVVVCADGRLVRSGDGGAVWQAIATVEGALTVSARQVSGADTVDVARVGPGCTGVEIAGVTDGTTKRVSCVQTSLVGAAGRISLSVVGDGGWLAVGDATWRSDVTLTTWRRTA
ncbi:hypothetical protein [Terrabacter sp. 2YAF2]|uniref:hypothetical protein n=1 Tax=Terrabacter sp. 2YAF2 TaxID=3233026 RepID=UPI003F985236